MNILITILIAFTGGFVLYKLKVPGGLLVGAIIAVAVFNILSGEAKIWSWGSILVQILTGAYIGCMVTEDTVKSLAKLIGPYITIMISFLVLNIFMGVIFYKMTSMDLLTSLFCAAPGGMTDIPIIAMDMGADASLVALMQFVRMIFGMVCLPTIIVLADKVMEPNVGYNKVELANVGNEANKQITVKEEVKKIINFIPVLLIAALAGILGKKTGLPAGTLTFAIIVVGIIKIKNKSVKMPTWLRRVAQILSGCCIGMKINISQLQMIKQMVIPAIILCLCYIICCVGIGKLISWRFKISLRESMLSLSPAGATEMMLIASDLGVYSVNLSVLVICRLVGVTLLFPQIFHAIVYIFN